MTGIFTNWCYKELIKTIFFCLAAFYLLYVLIDYSSRISSYQAIRFQWWMLFEYYGLIFIRRLEVLFPFALLIATASTLQTVWQLHGWIPLLQGGRSLKKLLTPFYVVGVISTLFLWYNEQSLIPLAMKRLNHIESLYFHKGEGISELNTRSSIRLKEGGALFFDSFDAQKQALVDVWYLPRWNEIWHIEKLDISKERPVGEKVDAFTVGTHLIQEQDFREKVTFDKMHVTWEHLLEASVDPLNLSISDLIGQQFDEVVSPQEKNEGFATLLKKLLFPTLACLAVLGIIPYFVTFERDPPFFLFYLAAILAYLGFYLLISSLYLISAAHVFSPLLALLIPFSALWGLLLRKQQSGPV
jgi:lipopolysaccharide export system permease protein